MRRYEDYNNHKLSEDQQRRMNHGTALILGAIAAGFVIYLVVYSLPDWGWVVDVWSREVLRYGYQR